MQSWNQHQDMLWVTPGDVQEPPCSATLWLLRINTTCPSCVHRMPTHTQGLSQQRQGIVKLRLSTLTELCHSADQLVP
ncbi:hypothetical protein INR49_020721, partial [Caranx melampygus]